MARLETVLACVGLLAGFTSLASAWPAREQLNLNGRWMYVKVKSLDEPPPATGWQEIDVPGTLSGYDYQRAWFRRTFDAPAAWAGKRVKLRLAGAKFCPVVYVNGRKVGEHYGGYEPCIFDITDVVKPGAQNEIRVGVYDWTGIFIGPHVDFPAHISWDMLRGFPTNHADYPIGGLYQDYGLWDDVTAYAVPAVYVSNVSIVTKVSSRELQVTYDVANESDAAARATVKSAVLDRDRQVLALPPEQVSVPAGQTATVTATVPWKPGQVRLWSPEHPALYFLQTSLTGAGPADHRRDRFGFREITIKGPDFYLNGVKRHMLASASWPMAEKTHDQIAATLRALKTANIIAFRTHTQPWREIWYDVADEVGLCMIPECAVWNDDTTYRLDDPTFWQHWGMLLTGMVHNLRNHPSVIMWSLENEFCGPRASAGTVYEQKLADLGRLVKRLDPTRPITFESDGDPGGVTDVIGMHYPNEPPGVRLWPQAAYWMDKPRTFGKTQMFLPNPSFLWARKKPLYIGEYLWYPAGTPAAYTLICGDEAYRSLNDARMAAKSATWRWQTVAYRHYGVSGMCPWTLVEGGPINLKTNEVMRAQAWAMQHLAAYTREATRRAYAGQKVPLHLEVFNDTPAAVEGTLKVELVNGREDLADGGMPLRMEPADHFEREVTLKAPEVSRVTEGRLRLTIDVRGRRAFSDERPFTIYPAPKLAAGEGLFLYDPAGATAKLLAAQGVVTRPVADLMDLQPDPPHVLVIGEKALDPMAAKGGGWAAADLGAHLAKLVAAGWRVIVLQQGGYPGGMFPVHLDDGTSSTMAFATAPSHPVLKGLPDDAFKFWAPDGVVTAGEVMRPLGGGYQALVVTGHPDGISHCALLEERRGRGTTLYCQMPVVARFSAEPMAAELLGRMLAYAASYRGGLAPATLIGGDAAYRQALADLGLVIAGGEGSGAAAGASQAAASGPATAQARLLVIVRGGADVSDALLDRVRAGGTLLLDRPDPEVLTRVGEAAGLGLRTVPYTATVFRAEGDSPLLAHILREDLWWTAPGGARPSYTDQPLATNMATGALQPDVAIKPLRTIPAADMAVEGAIVRRQDDYIGMFTVATARMSVDLPHDGMYAVQIDAKSTPCDGGYGVAQVSVDGTAVGSACTGANWGKSTVLAEMTAGRHDLAVSFVNDSSNSTEDRNLFLRSVAIGEAPAAARSLVPLASGPAAACLALGKGRVIINLVKWDTEDRNATKARRYFGALLTGSGAEFHDEYGATFDVTKFTHDPSMPYFRAQGGAAYLSSAGWVEGQIDVPRDGTYRIAVEASGTPADGQLPIVAVVLDGKSIGDLNLTSSSWRRYTVSARMTAGRHRLRLIYTNDYYAPPEDRNLVLGTVTVLPGQ